MSDIATTGGFHEYLLQDRGLSPSTAANYISSVHSLLREGKSPGWGEHETAQASERRWQFYLSHPGSGKFASGGWNHWRRYNKARLDVDIPELEPLVLVKPPDAVVEAIAALVKAAGIRRARTLRWSHVDREAGMVANNEMQELASSHTFGRDRLKVVLKTLFDFYSPSGEDCLVLPADAGAEGGWSVMWSFSRLRGFVAQAADLRRARALGGVSAKAPDPGTQAAPKITPHGQKKSRSKEEDALAPPKGLPHGAVMGRRGKSRKSIGDRTEADVPTVTLAEIQQGMGKNWNDAAAKVLGGLPEPPIPND